MSQKKSKKRKNIKVKQIAVPKKSPTISLCMMVKDEEELLPQCLDSVKDHVDEIIVVDTGSTDRTVEIAETHGAKVYHHPWENNFSKHRNQSISYATGDWILIMDADEELDAGTVHLLRKVIHEAPTSVISFNVRSYMGNGAYYTEGNSTRLFKNGLGFHYKGYVHNQLVARGKATPSSIVLWHHGYDIPDEQLDAKKQRSLQLLRKQIEEFPDDLPTRHHLAMTLLACKEHEEAYQEAKLTLDMMRKRDVIDPHFSWTYFVAVASLMKLERFDEADSLCLKALETFDWSIDIYHCLTQIKFVKKEYEKVIEYGYKFLKLRGEIQKAISRLPLFQFETVHRDWVIYRSMGYAHLYLGNYDKGIEVFEKALNRAPECDQYTLAEEIGQNLTKSKEWDKAISFLESLPKEEKRFEKGLVELGANYERVGRLDEAVTLYDQIEGTFDEDAAIPFKRGLLLLKLKRHDEAAVAFEKAVKRNPDYVEAWINWGLALENLGEKELAEKKYLSALELEPNSPKGNLNLGLFYFNNNEYLNSKDYLLKASPYFSENIYLQLALARSYLEAGEIEAMIAVCEKILRLLDLPADLLIESMSQVAELFVGISERLLQHKKLDSFDVALDMAKHLRPERTDGLKQLSRLAFDLSEPMRGASILETLLAIDPKDPEILSLVQGHIKELEG